MFGSVPITRFRHTVVAVTPDNNSRLAGFAQHMLLPLGRNLQEGSVVLMYGGYNTMGQEFGMEHFEVGNTSLSPQLRAPVMSVP